MLNASLLTENRDISERIQHTQDGVIIEINAELRNVPMGTARKNVAATYRCKYRDGLLTFGVWMRGFVGTWTRFENSQLTQNDLGTPWPE